MGRGTRTSRAGGAARLRGGAASSATSAIDAPTPWYQAAGPEATEEELARWTRKWGERHAEMYPDGYVSGEEQARIELAAARDMIAHFAAGGQVVGVDDFRYTPRRNLEAILALYSGKSLEQWRSENAHRSWSSLMEEAGETEGMRYEAYLVEKALYSFYQQNDRLPELADAIPLNVQQVDPESFEQVRAKVAHLIDVCDLGQQTGRPEDYSRREMRGMLGFRERDCKHLSDDELRGMCLDGHLMPRWVGSPSHVDLALAEAGRGHHDGARLAKNFTRAMRMTYAELLTTSGFKLGVMDDGERPAAQITADLHAANPLVAALFADPTSLTRGLRNTAITAGVVVDRPDSDRHASALAEFKLQTPLELQYRPALDSFCETFHPERKPAKISGKLPPGSRGVYGLYRHSDRSISINTSLSKLIDQAQAGKATPRQVERAVSTVAHELIHSVEGRDSGSIQTHSELTTTPEHTLDEGVTEALARVHTQRLAESMGLWRSEDGDLRQHAEEGSYPSEVATVLTLGQALWGAWDPERARAGIKQPEDVDPQVLVELEKLHIERGPWGRISAMQRRLEEVSGDDDSARSFRAIESVLKECKREAYQWRIETHVEEDPETGQRRENVRNVRPDDLTGNLVDMIDGLLSGATPSSSASS